MLSAGVATIVRSPGFEALSLFREVNEVVDYSVVYAHCADFAVGVREYSAAARRGIGSEESREGG